MWLNEQFLYFVFFVCFCKEIKQEVTKGTKNHSIYDSDELR